MVTRAKSGIVIPLEKLNLSVTHVEISPLPKTYRIALADPHWSQSMTDEYTALVDNHTWTLVLCPNGANVVSDK